MMSKRDGGFFFFNDGQRLGSITSIAIYNETNVRIFLVLTLRNTRLLSNVLIANFPLSRLNKKCRKGVTIGVRILRGKTKEFPVSLHQI